MFRGLFGRTEAIVGPSVLRGSCSKEYQYPASITILKTKGTILINFLQTTRNSTPRLLEKLGRTQIAENTIIITPSH